MSESLHSDMNYDILYFPLVAREFAKEAHGSQLYGDKPYTYHLDMVWRNVVEYSPFCFDDTTFLCEVAWLHDVVEDTPFTVEDVEQQFGPEVASIVDLVTNQETKEETFKRIRTSSDAVFVKLCDRLANVEEDEKNKMYRKRHPLFKSILYQSGEFDRLWTAIEQQLEM